MKKVLVFGSFDVLHPGHLYFFKEAKKHGNHLSVVISRNQTLEEVKGHKPKYDENDRLALVQSVDVVDRAVLGNPGNKYSIIKDINPDIICLGYDQKAFTENIEQELKTIGVNATIIRLKPYKEHMYKSSKLISKQ